MQKGGRLVRGQRTNCQAVNRDKLIEAISFKILRDVRPQLTDLCDLYTGIFKRTAISTSGDDSGHRSMFTALDSGIYSAHHAQRLVIRQRDAIFSPHIPSGREKSRFVLEIFAAPLPVHMAGRLYI